MTSVGSVATAYLAMTVPSASAAFVPPRLWKFECLHSSPFVSVFKFASSSLKAMELSPA